MNIKSTPSKAFSMKINRNNNYIELQWHRNQENIEYIIKNLEIFHINMTTEIKNQILNLPNKTSKKLSTDIIYI